MRAMTTSSSSQQQEGVDDRMVLDSNVGGDGGSPDNRINNKTPPPPASQSAATAKAAVEFAHTVGRLKTTPRTGWVRRGVPKYESVADHSWRVAVLSLLLGDSSSSKGMKTTTTNHQQGQEEKVVGGTGGIHPKQKQKLQPPTKDATMDQDDIIDVGKCMQLAVVHDLAECLVGDIAPGDNVSKADKQRLEKQAMFQLDGMLQQATAAAVVAPSNNNASSTATTRSSPFPRTAETTTSSSLLMDLFHEYEERASPEAAAVKDLDLLDMILQAEEYEQRFGIDLAEFFDGTPPERFQNPVIRNLAIEVHRQRSIRRTHDNQSEPGEEDPADCRNKIKPQELYALSKSDYAFVDEYSKASNLESSDIAQIVRALRCWESPSIKDGK